MNREVGFPRTLIQIHYHDRPCGVMRVIRSYARAFRVILGKNGCDNILICEKTGEEEYPEFPDGAMLSLPAAGYRTFSNRTAFLSARKKIVARIASLLLSDEIRLPVAIVAHNLTLCKNAALVSAFAELAKAFVAQTSDFRFFSVAHDFAEEGRVDQLIAINRLEKLGIAIRKEIAAAGAPVHFLAVNPRAKKTLDSAGLSASLLVNPVNAEQVVVKNRGVAKNLLTRRLADYSRANGIAFKPNRPIFVYPSRTILRKNPFEAIAIACIVNNANLLLGGAGSSAADRGRHTIIKQMVREFRLPVITNVRDAVMSSESLGKFVRNNPIPLLYAGADCVLTCAVTEGFGFLLHEPWLYDTRVCGRRPAGFEFSNRKMGAHFYDTFPVPAEWVDTVVLLKKYAKVAARCFPGKKQREIFMHEVEKKMAGECIDFAFLDEESQADMMRKLLSSEKIRSSWRTLLENPQPGWPGAHSIRQAAAADCAPIRKFIEQQFSMKKFTARFKKGLGVIPVAPARAADLAIIEKEYGDAGTFRVF